MSSSCSVVSWRGCAVVVQTSADTLRDGSPTVNQETARSHTQVGELTAFVGGRYDRRDGDLSHVPGGDGVARKSQPSVLLPHLPAARSGPLVGRTLYPRRR